MSQMVVLIQRAGYLLRELNEKFYFYIDIQTAVSWAVIVLMYLLYRLVNKYYENDKQIDSLELIKLLSIYLFILLAIIASYIDIDVIRSRANPEYSFFIITVGAIALVILMAWASRDQQGKKKWIIGTLYVPIILLVLTNGRILEERTDVLKGLIPRSDFSFLSLPGETSSMRVGGKVSSEQVQKVEDIIASHKAVEECAIVGRQDEDMLIKPYAYVVLKDGAPATDSMKKDIREYATKQMKSGWIPPGNKKLIIVSNDRFIQLPPHDKKYDKIRMFLNEYKAVKDSKVVVTVESADAYVLLKEEYAKTEDLKKLQKEIEQFVSKKIINNNRVSVYLAPVWIKFITKEQMPKDSKGNIERVILQKKAQNWSDIFPNFPKNDPFIKELSGS